MRSLGTLGGGEGREHIVSPHTRDVNKVGSFKAKSLKAKSLKAKARSLKAKARDQG